MQTLEERRHALGITVTAAHHALGVSRPTYYSYEKNPLNMPLGKYIELCAFLDVEPGDIFLPSALSQTERKEAQVG